MRHIQHLDLLPIFGGFLLVRVLMRGILFYIKAKNDQVLIFPESLAAKAWAHDLVLINPEPRARSRKRQEEIITDRGQGNRGSRLR